MCFQFMLTDICTVGKMLSVYYILFLSVINECSLPISP